MMSSPRVTKWRPIVRIHYFCIQSLLMSIFLVYSGCSPEGIGKTIGCATQEGIAGIFGFGETPSCKMQAYCKGNVLHLPCNTLFAPDKIDCSSLGKTCVERNGVATCVVKPQILCEKDYCSNNKRFDCDTDNCGIPGTYLVTDIEDCSDEPGRSCIVNDGIASCVYKDISCKEEDSFGFCDKERKGYFSDCFHGHPKTYVDCTKDNKVCVKHVNSNGKTEAECFYNVKCNPQKGEYFCSQDKKTKEHCNSTGYVDAYYECKWNEVCKGDGNNTECVPSE